MVTLTETASRIRIFGSNEEINTITDHFKFRPENYWRADSYQMYKLTEGKRGWSGYLYPVEKTSPTSAEARRGWLRDVLDLCRIHRFDLNTSKLLPRSFKGMVPDDVPDDIVASEFQLDEGQRRCICAWLSEAIGMCQVTVSGGKTVTFCAAAAMIKKEMPDARFIYFTASERLANQVIKEARKFLPSWDIAQFGGGKNELMKKDSSGNEVWTLSKGRDMVVVTGSMLSRHFIKLKRDGWFNTFAGILVDECHHAPSDSWSKAIMAIPAFYRLGASDTTLSEDKTRCSDMHGLVGPILEKIEAAPLIHVGRIAKPIVHVVDIRAWKNKFKGVSQLPTEETDAWALIKGVWQRGTYLGPVYETDPDQKYEDGLLRDKDGELVKVPNCHRLSLPAPNGKMGEFEVESKWCLLERMYDKSIISFKERNQLIARWAKFYADQGLQTLVVATRTLHVYILQAMISKLVGADKVRILFSEHSTKQRDETFDWLRATPGCILISSVVKEGVSVNEIRAGVIADYVASFELLNQMIGRMIRKKYTGENVGRITMFVERQHPTYYRGSMDVIKGLEKFRAYEFKYPCTEPESAQAAETFKAAEPYAGA